MFDVSFAELGLVGLIGLLLLGPKDMLQAIKYIKTFLSSLREKYDEYIKYFNETMAEEEPIVKIVFDEEGNPQKAYDINRIKPFLKDE